MIEKYTFPNCNRYFKKDFNKLRYQFVGSKDIQNNYSQAFQDMFALTMLNGKKNGTYVEIGGDHGVIISNTYLLETQFEWNGVAFEIDQKKVDEYNLIRNNKCLCADATTFDYKSFFKEKGFLKQIDYLQVDIEPAWRTLNALKALPLDDYRFSVITYETDLYHDGPDFAEESRKILQDCGYELVVRNVANEGNPFEDWYVDPNIVDKKIIEKIKIKSFLNTEAINILIGEK
jgi:hypothetical protein